jgi:cytochrome P450
MRAVRWSAEEECWYVVGLAETIQVLRSTEAVSSMHNVGARRLRPPKRVWRASVIGSDPPEHGRLRAPARAAFTPRAVARFRAFCDERTGDLLDDALACQGPVDAVEALGRPLSRAVTCKVLAIGEGHREVLRSVALVADNFDGIEPTGELYEAFEIVDRFIADKLAEERSGEDSILDSLIESHRQGALSAEQLQDMALVLIAAGTHTTMHAVSNAISVLADHPRSRQLLAAEKLPIDRFAEEVLRFTSPVQRIYRTAVKPLEIGDQRIPPGDFLCLDLGRANRDPRAFDNPDTFDPNREPKRSLAFGHGIHHCLGAALARVELAAAIKVIQRRVTRIDHAGPSVPVTGVFGGFESLPVELTPR